MNCNKKYTNDYDKTSNNIIIDTENYGSNLNNDLSNITNSNQDDDYYVDIKLPHQKSTDENINTIYYLFIKIIKIIMVGKNPIPYIFSSADTIFGFIFILLIFFILIILFYKIFIS